MSISRRHLLASLPGLAAGLPFLESASAGEAAHGVLLAKVLEPGVDPAPYLVSEKYDGVRAIWDGRELRFRSGRVVPAPAWFTASLPARALDGELWLGRQRFDELSAIVRKAQPVDAEWRQLHYMVFEAPDAEGPFEQRMRTLQSIVRDAKQPQVQCVAQTRVVDRAALERRLDEVVRAGGEGLALHLAAAPYVTGRSDALLKFKPVLDTEAVVVAQVAGQGKFVGMLGALELQTPEGRRFFLGTGFSDAVRRDPPPVGAMVTYAYRDLTSSGLPRFASYIGVRDAY